MERGARDSFYLAQMDLLSGARCPYSDPEELMRLKAMRINGESSSDTAPPLFSGKTEWERRVEQGVSRFKKKAVQHGFSGYRKRVLLSTARPFADRIIPFLASIPRVELRLICEESADWFSEKYGIPCYTDVPSSENKLTTRAGMDIEAAKLIEWSDIVIVAPLDAGSLASLLVGLTTTLTLKIIRGWSVEKSLMLVPAMSVNEWESPLTGRNLDELERQRPWDDVFPPLLSRFEAPDTMIQMPWDGLDSFAETIWKKVDPNIDLYGEAILLVNQKGSCDTVQGSSLRKDDRIQNQDGSLQKMDKTNMVPKQLPLEILLLIFEKHLADWEIAKAVGIETNIPIPEEWAEHFKHTKPSDSLEYHILKGSFESIKSRLPTLPRWKPLSNLASHLIFKFSRLDILTHLSENHMDLFWTTQHLTQLPLRASSIYNNPSILTWWRDCPALPAKDYHPDAVDGASRAGFVDVLEWWRTSGLPLVYSERSLESASAEGNIAVLEWWKRASENAPASNPIPLRTGKSILLAAQAGCTSSLAWWDASGIPYTHSDSVTRIASTHGHVPVLDLWHRIKGPKLIFDNQVLVGATKNGHVDVLEWWKQSGLRVEFKTCDIEEALEDAVSGREESVRRWWDRNGLNLGVGTSEWMKVKVL
ncbi:hypothetical protein FQN54_007158 [Arachnomyces sp. PD_36]|nr:hypothetical protein FQN54_007158 [Arachnomyces sp. PD_36]